MSHPSGGRSPGHAGDEWQLLKTKGRWKDAVRAYLASITFADAMVGRLIRGLERSDFASNTVIVLWSDHGWHLGEKSHWHKFTLWEEATRVPLIIVAPGITKPGGRCSRPVSLIDLYPTLTDLCRLKLRKGLDGQSLVPLLKKPDRTWSRPAIITHSRNNHAVRSERYRYIRYADGTQELYDHRNDPNEWTNLAGRAGFAKVIESHVRWLPKRNAGNAPRKSAYVFDAKRYRWKRRDRKPSPP